ncbi:hypothetical protein RQP46_000601 [Phenoliferia psychrophenolica]
MSSLVATMRDMNISSEPKSASRPNYGTSGRQFPCWVNAFEVTPSNITCYHYDVKILPDKPTTPPRLNRQIWAHLDENMNVFDGVPVAYDGRAMAYSPTKLPADEGTWEILLPEDDGGTSTTGKARMFTITIRYTRTIDLSKLGVFVRGGASDGTIPDASEIQSATQALNVLIQHGPALMYPSRAASFFLPPENKQHATIAKGLEMWRGFYTSLRAGPGKLFVNIDIASQPMYQSGDLPAVVLAFLRAQSRGISFADLSASKIPARAYVEVDRFVRNVKITLKAKGPDGIEPVRKIKSIERGSASDIRFQIEEKDYTVEPCVRVSKVAIWPLELCDVQPGQKYSKKLDPDQTAEAIKLTTVGPKDRVPMLRHGLGRIQPDNTQISPTNKAGALEKWGVKINREPMVVTARELQPPTINYKMRPVQPREGVWDMRGNHFHQAATIQSWLVFVFDSDRFFPVEQAQDSIMGLVSACQSVGLNITNQRPAIHYVPRGCDIAGFILSKGAELVQKEGRPPQMLICYLPRKPCDEYGVIKRFGDVEKGVATQCLFINKAKRGNNQYYGNVALKMNVKLRGQNSILDVAGLGPIAEKPTMVFGCDVTHPSPGSMAPSISALVGSMDSKCTLYGTSIRVQSSRIEIIAHFEEMVIELIKQFEAKLKTRPHRLIFFRDGVSEGQFSSTLATAVKTEVAAIRSAIEKLGGGYAPTVTYVVCGKRHHMSFFPKNDADADRKNFNVKSGTTIDTDITSPLQFDWYTQSHASLLGTGRSAHYTVLVDDNKFSADVLQQLVFNLTYARCTRSVSYVTPAYYADRVCTRAQLILKRDDDDSSTVISSHSGASEDKVRHQHLNEYVSRLKSIHPNHSESLYFM